MMKNMSTETFHLKTHNFPRKAHFEFVKIQPVALSPDNASLSMLVLLFEFSIKDSFLELSPVKASTHKQLFVAKVLGIHPSERTVGPNSPY
jgi:hypothetical protein